MYNLIFFLWRKGLLYPCPALNLLCIWGWLGSSNCPASGSSVLGLQVCTMTPSLCSSGDGLQGDKQPRQAVYQPSYSLAPILIFWKTVFIQVHIYMYIIHIYVLTYLYTYVHAATVKTVSISIGASFPHSLPDPDTHPTAVSPHIILR